MPWVKLDENFYDHPKLVAAGPLAGYLWVCSLGWCNSHLTDGHIPHAVVPRLAHFADLRERIPGEKARWVNVDPHLLAQRLVSVGLWHPTEGGYLIHDYDVQQKTREQVERERAEAAERMRNVRANRGRTSGEVREPVPSRPDPKGLGTGAGTSKSVSDGPPAPSGGGPGATALPPELVERNVSNVRSLRRELGGAA